MNIPELKELSSKNLRSQEVKALNQLLKSLRERLRELRFSVNANQLKNIRSLRQTKKIIARILTIIKNKK